jgi:hypothetical protein
VIRPERIIHPPACVHPSVVTPRYLLLHCRTYPGYFKSYSPFSRLASSFPPVSCKGNCRFQPRPEFRSKPRPECRSEPNMLARPLAHSFHVFSSVLLSILHYAAFHYTIKLIPDISNLSSPFPSLATSYYQSRKKNVWYCQRPGWLVYSPAFTGMC